MLSNRLQAFRVVAAHLSFSKAAKTLQLTQPAISFQVKALEEELKCKLFNRHTREVSLTKAGEIVKVHVDRIVSEYAALLVAIKSTADEQIVKFRPATSHEADKFITDNCRTCRHSYSDTYGACEIQLNTLLYHESDPQYPAEWRYVKVNGKPVPACTAHQPFFIHHPHQKSPV